MLLFLSANFFIGQQFFDKIKSKHRTSQLQQGTKDAIALKRQCLDYGRFTGEIHDHDHDHAFKQELRHLEKAMNSLLRKDIQLHYDQLVSQLQHAGELSNHRLVYRILRNLGRKKGTKPAGPRPLPMLQKPDGSYAKTFDEQQQVWMDQFSKVEAGLE